MHAESKVASTKRYTSFLRRNGWSVSRNGFSRGRTTHVANSIRGYDGASRILEDGRQIEPEQSPQRKGRGGIKGWFLNHGLAAYLTAVVLAEVVAAYLG